MASNPIELLVHWTPRILGVLFALFLSLFAVDVFGQGYGFWEMIGGLLMHLIPTAVTLAVLAVAWRWEGIGGVLFLVLGGCYLALSSGWARWPAGLAIAGPLFLIGALFLIDWLCRARKEP